MSITPHTSEATMSAAASSFRPLPLSRVASYRESIRRGIAAGAFGEGAIRVDFNDGTFALRNIEMDPRMCFIYWSAPGIEPETFCW